MKLTQLLLLASLGAGLPLAAQRPQGASTLSLNGEWRFATDPLDRGLASAYHLPANPAARWDTVSVPHCWYADPRYPYTGAAFYRRSFETPAAWSALRVRLHFGAAFYRASVWVNGRLAGHHEGGYTPFHFDITPLLHPAGQPNLLAVRVDNRWDETTLPGARPGDSAELQFYPWLEYGGLTRDVFLQALPPVSIAALKIETDPDLAKLSAHLRARLRLRNDSAVAATVPLAIETEGQRAQASVDLAPFSETTATLELDLPHVTLWHPDNPHLSTLTATAGAHSLSSNYGVRKIEARGAQLLLNGEPIRMAGANRPVDDPQFGALEPPQVLERDLRLMKEAGLELMRLIHYAPDPRLVDWADRHGLLLILEAGNWQLSPSQMDDPLMRARWQSQMRELVERDWNHPSVIAWSVGNEFPSDTPAGLRWVRDGRDFVRSLDPSRLVTFASNHAARATNKTPADEASGLVDLVMINTYSSGAGLLRELDHVHELWPSKPLLISEFGARADAVDVYGRPMEGDASQIQRTYFEGFIQALRARPWISGASVWTFNDYRSRFPGTHADGYRWWGLVDPARNKRPMYHWMRREMSPAVLSTPKPSPAGLAVTLSTRADFPAFTLRNYTLRWSWLDSAGKTLSHLDQPLPVLAPGSTHNASAPPATGAAALKLELLRPTGFVMADLTHSLGKAAQ